MENNLSWFLIKNITPKTQAYKDFVKEMKHTPEQRMMDGDRKFTERKKYLQIFEI